MKIRGGIFDMDGTLLASMHVWDTAGGDYLLQRGVTPPPDLRETTRSMSLKQAARYFKEEFGLPESEEAILAGVDAIVAVAYHTHIQPKPGTAEFLEFLHTKGVKMCIASATNRPMVEDVLGRTGLAPYFGRIFTCGEVGAGKNKPLIFEKALAFLGTEKEETWIFEDALYAVRTAKNAGFHVAGVQDDFEPETAEVRRLCDLYAEKILELKAYFA